MNLAEHLGMSVARCRVEVSSAEYVRWCAKSELDAADAKFAQEVAGLGR